MSLVAAAVLVLLGTGGQEPAAPERLPIEKKVVSASGVSVHFLTIPWGPNTFAAMERGGDSYYSHRTWPFARLETASAFKLGGHPLEAGNFALVFHPRSADGGGMRLEVRKITVPEFLIPGNVMTRTPEGVTVATSFAVFETVDETAPALDIALEAVAGGAQLVVRYGNRRLTRKLEFD
jgi:hypothetical protein